MPSLLALLLLAESVVAPAAQPAPQFEPPAAPVPIIFETDFSSDCDDVGALAMLHHLASDGQVDLLMVGINRDDRGDASAAAVDAINTHFGRGDIPIGTSRTNLPALRSVSKYAYLLRDEFENDAASDGKMPAAVPLYRKTLAEASDNSVVIVSVGALTNLADLLTSEPDDHSDLTGVDLVKQKAKLLVAMAGQFPSSEERGRPEWNLKLHPAANAVVLEQWPTPIVWSGWEVGAYIITGTPLQDVSEESPIRRAYELHRPSKDVVSSLDAGRASYDQTAVLYAAFGPADNWELVPGRMTLGEDNMTNGWEDGENSQQAYLVPKKSNEELAEIINGLMLPAK